jgi:acyl-CoA hydrolase
VLKSKSPAKSVVSNTQIVLPKDANPYHTCFGGVLMQWMEEVAAFSAHKHANQRVVPVSVDDVFFNSPVFIGELVHLKATVTRSFYSSLEVFLSFLL